MDASSHALAPVPAAEQDPLPPSTAGRVGAIAIAVGVLGFMAWVAAAPLDEGVPGGGSVTVDTKRKPVQHLGGGIVREVLVREGSSVSEGQLLVRLDDAAARAAHDAARQRYLGLRALQGRLQAEQSGAPAISFHPDLQAEAADPLVRRQMDLETAHLQARRGALAGDLAVLQQGIAAQVAQAAAARAMAASRTEQLELLRDELANTRALVSEGYAPRNRQLELERMAAEARTSLAELRGNLLRAESMAAELKQRQVQRRLEDRKDVDAQLAEVSRELEAGESRYRSLREELQRMVIRAPASGQVVGLVVQAPGAVVAPGQKLMDIVPAGEPLLLEARVPPHLGDRVHAGTPVDVRFAAFAHTPQLVVPGTVLSVSGDVLADAAGSPPYYLARVQITDEGHKRLGNRALQPGMPVEVVFRTGERTLLAYWLHPLTRRLAASMKEE
jgi:protease secretion system membrane fusion protein